MSLPDVVSREQWLEARRQLLDDREVRAIGAKILEEGPEQRLRAQCGELGLRQPVVGQVAVALKGAIPCLARPEGAAGRSCQHPE